MKAAGTVDLAIIHPPEDLKPAIDALDGGAAPVQPLELLDSAGHAGEPPQVDLQLNAHGQAVVAITITGGVAEALPTLMAGGTAILQRAALGLMTEVGHRVTQRRGVDAIVAEDGAGLVVDDVPRRAPAQHFLGFFELDRASCKHSGTAPSSAAWS